MGDQESSLTGDLQTPKVPGNSSANRSPSSHHVNGQTTGKLYGSRVRKRARGHSLLRGHMSSRRGTRVTAEKSTSRVRAPVCALGAKAGVGDNLQRKQTWGWGWVGVGAWYGAGGGEEKAGKGKR